MMPKTISASSLNVADKCLARYKAENILFTPNPAPKLAANVGTSVHGALEDYVRAVYMERTHRASKDLILELYDRSYKKTFDRVELGSDQYIDGKELTLRWFERTDLSEVEVLSVEKKYRMPVPSSAGDIPLTYIWDRCDRFTENGRRILRVTDYKTIRENMGTDKLRRNLQARIYDLAARTRFRDDNIDEFQVVFDLLRYEAVGVIFSREDAVDTWAGVKARLERILAASGDNPPETLNPECAYCVRKVQCKTLQRNINGGGVFSLEDIDDVVQLRYDLANQSKGITELLGELDTRIIAHAQENQTLAFTDEAGEYEAAISARKSRQVNTEAVAKILGPDVVARHGRMNVTELDKMIKSGQVTEDQAIELQRAVTFTVSAPSVRINRKNKN